MTTLPSVRKRVLYLIDVLTKLASSDPGVQAAASADINALPEGFFDDFGVPKKGLKALEADSPSLLQRTANPRVLELLITFLADSPKVLTSILPILAHKLSTADDGLAQAILYAFGNAGKDSVPHLSEILKFAAHSNDQVRWRVAWAYSRIQPLSQDHLHHFEQWIADSHSTTRLYATMVLAAAPSSPPAVRNLLTKAKDDPDSSVAHYAKEGLK